MCTTTFQQIFRCLHLTDGFGQPGHDPLFKVRKLVDLRSPNFESEYNIHEELTVDGAMPMKISSI